jgi:hypothetical protein
VGRAALAALGSTLSSRSSCSGVSWLAHAADNNEPSEIKRTEE